MDIICSNYAQGRKTFIISLTFPNLSTVSHLLERMSYGGDVFELRVDLLSASGTIEQTNLPSLSYVREQVQLLRKQSPLPILFAIRTFSQGGKFPNNATQEAHDLLMLAIELGCEYIDVEVEWPAWVIDSIVARKGSSKIVASFHDWTGGVHWASTIMEERYHAVDRFGDILKLSVMTRDFDDCHELSLFIRKHRKLSTKPIIAIGMGTNGQLARITSPITIVTHDLMSTSSAPGQLTMAEIHQALNLLGQLPKRKFYVLGWNISHSLSPTLHNAGFKELGLPYHYSIHESPSIDESVEEIISRPDFGGASVTFPHKLQVARLLQSVSPQAQKIGSVNTIVVRQTPEGTGKTLIGDNTDWSGIKACIENSGVQDLTTSPAIVVGAGGAARAACYAIQELGIPTIININRTLATSQKMASTFPTTKFQFFESWQQLCKSGKVNSRVIVACVPADDFDEDKIPVEIFSEVEREGILVEMAYRPQITGLMKVAKKYQGWKVVRGTDVLLKQAFAQFSLWTGRRAPVSVMREAVTGAL